MNPPVAAGRRQRLGPNARRGGIGTGI